MSRARTSKHEKYLRERNSVTKNAQELLAAVERVQQASNAQLRRDTGLEELAYSEAKAELISAQRVYPYRCRGGGLRLPAGQPEHPIDVAAVEQAKQAIVEEERKIAEEERKERDLYPYVEGWARNVGYGKVSVVGDLHRRDRWENPDLIAIDQIELDYLPGQEIEVTTIEVKLFFSIEGIWQAANYRSFSHLVYLACFERPEEIRNVSDGRLYQTAIDLGLGILSLSPAGAGGVGVKCQEIHSAGRQSPRVLEIDRLLSDFHQELGLTRVGTVLAGQIHQAMPRT